MVIRRIREHVAAHNWFAVAIDLAIVVAGVFLGTQVNNWNQARIERTQGENYRERLIADLRSNEADLIDRKAYFSAVRKHAQAALAALNKPGSNDGEAFLIDAYQASQITPRKAKRFTYDELISTGRFEQVGDVPLREQIASYYVGMETTNVTFSFVPPYREHIRQLMPNAAQQAVRTHCPERLSLAPDGTVLARFPESCRLDLDPVTMADAVTAVRASSGIARDLTRHIADLDMKITLADAGIFHGRQLKGLIEKAQSGDH